MDFRILGPLEADVSGQPIALGRRQERLLVGLLLLDVARPVPVSRLSELIWGEGAPDASRRTLQTYVARLRGVLEPHGVRVRYAADGYAVVCDPRRVDLHRFTALVAAARECWSTEDRAGLLREALSLWRGPVLADVTSPVLRDRLDAVYGDRRLDAIELAIETDLDRGRHEQVIEELGELVRAHPARERLVGFLMTALYRAGRPQEALEVYRKVRDTLVADLGIEPSTMLQDIHRRLLDGRISASPPPSRTYLPRDVPAFTGRFAQLAHLDRIADAGTDRTDAVVIGAVGGAAGIGKTALAVHWAVRNAKRYPDGQLYVNLQGYSASVPLDPARAIGLLLLQLGQPEDQIPSDLEHAAAMYRSIMSMRTVLVLLDNASAADQVRPILPQSPGSLVLVTSRSRLPGLLVRDGAHSVDVPELDPTESAALLRRLMPGVGLRDSDLAVLARACGHLPLALRIAAAHIVSHPEMTTSEHLARLTGSDRRAALDVPDDPDSAVWNLFRYSYEALPDAARRVYRLVGLLPGASQPLVLIATVAGQSTDVARALLRILVDAYMVNEVRPGWYEMHDLLREYAVGLARSERDVASGRIAGWYLALAHAVSTTVTPYLSAVQPDLPETPVELPFQVGDPSVQLAFLAEMRANLAPAVRFAGESGHATAAWHIVYLLSAILGRGSDMTTAISTAEEGLNAALQHGDTDGERIMRSTLGAYFNNAQRPDLAIPHLERAVALARQTGNVRGGASALNNLGRALNQNGQHTEAAMCFTEALAAMHESNDVHNIPMVMTNLGQAVARAGDHALSRTYLAQALERWRALDRVDGQAQTYYALGRTYAATGNHESAARNLRLSIDLARQAGHDDIQTRALLTFAETLRELGALDDSVGAATTALRLSSDCGNIRLRAWSLRVLAQAHLHAGDTALAQTALDEARTVRTGLPDPAEDTVVAELQAHIDAL